MQTLISDGILHVLILENLQIDFHMASWFPCGVGQSVYAWSPQIYQILMILIRNLTLNFCNSQTCDPGKVKVRGSVQPMGLTASGCSPSCIV